MLDPNYIPDEVLTSILRNREWPDDESGCEKVALLSAEEAFGYYLAWHGIHGYTQQILSAVKGLDEAQDKAREQSISRPH